MKKIIKFFLCFVLTIVTVFVVSSSSNNVSSNVYADSKYTEIKDDAGNVVKHRNSSESVLRLTEYDYPTQELRACWVSNFVGSLPKYSTEANWKADYSAVLDKMEKYGLNCIIFHVRTHNNALYNSKLNPLATWFAGVNFDEFDPLEWAIEETHRRGIEFHAWLNPYRISDSFVHGAYPEGNPANDSSKLLTNGSGTILNPGLQSNRDFIVDTCMEVVENYDVDAIHFDDYFYISGVETSKSGDWKRQQVDLFIEDLANHLDEYNKKNNKAVQLGISPSGIYRNGGYSTNPTYDSNGNLTGPLYSNTSGFAHYDNYLYSDTLKWINEEWIDYIMPQTYWSLEQTVAQFGSLSRWWSWAVAKKDVNLYLGMGIYMPDDGNSNWKKNKNEIRDQILNASMYDEVGGFSLYSYNYMSSSNPYVKPGMDLLKDDYWSYKIPCDVKKALAPNFETLDPLNLSLNGTVLVWEKQDTIRGHIVYRVPNNKVLNVNDVSQIYYYGNDSYVDLEDLDNYVYYVSTVNLANEISEPYNTQSLTANVNYIIKQIDELPSIPTLDDEGKILRIKEIYENLSADDQAKITNYYKVDEYLELIEYKKVAYDTIVNFVELKNYSTNYQIKIQSLIKQTTQNLNLDASEDEINETLTEFEKTINSYPTAKVELKADIENGLQNLDNYYNSIDLSYYESYIAASITTKYETTKTRIENALSVEKINSIVEQYKKEVEAFSSYKDAFDAAVVSITNALNEEVKNLILTNKWLEEYADQLNVYKNELINSLYSKDKIEISKFPNSYVTTLKATLAAYVESLHQIDANKELVEAKKLEAISSIKAYAETTSNHKTIKDDYIEKVNKAQTIEEIDQLLIDFENAYNKQAEPESSCNFLSIISLVNLLSLVSIVYLLIRRKH